MPRSDKHPSEDIFRLTRNLDLACKAASSLGINAWFRDHRDIADKYSQLAIDMDKLRIQHHELAERTRKEIA